ncbi:BON domain-containing protein [Hahella sp. KA22]|uniref:BON domain-containing protein n=1 Tax=Hahella sp. KA22 TaxID=1628392 RepID=UPI000FDED829|nr:BON domain-containing protein [Hahella sp. KA22]AZZ94873.1 BON domain-containing protein [Hahella sp. KA22]QAY58246.1 BON domain-containing protein [Hahella sp. KA22]
MNKLAEQRAPEMKTKSVSAISDRINETRLETQIWTTFALSPYLRALDLKVSVHEGCALLSGKVDEEVNKDLAKQIALGVKGIHTVEDQIVVVEDAVLTPHMEDRSYGDIIDDVTISAAVKSKLLSCRYADSIAAEVSTIAGKVTLTGTAGDKAAKKFAKAVAIHTQGVIGVDNALIINPGKARQPDGDASIKRYSDELGHYLSDIWITAKVKAVLLYCNSVSGSKISVLTHHHVVTLSGDLGSGAEKALAIEIAKNVYGVKRVNSKGLTFAAKHLLDS